MDSQIPTPTSTLNLYRRLFKGRKSLFAESDFAPANYFVINPVPHKHSGSWKPIFYRGDNPKYNPSTTAIGRARRSAWWGTFRIWLGDGVHEVLENEKRRAAKRKAERKNKFRKFFGKKPLPVEVEEETPVTGKVVLVRLQRTKGLNRKLVFEVEGEQYRWSGTRMFSSGMMSGIKGWSHNMKLIRTSDHALIATVEKSRWATYSRSINSDGPPNKKKQLFAVLKFYDRSVNSAGLAAGGQDQSKLTSALAMIDAAQGPDGGKDDEKDLNPEGSHSGNLTEDAIALSCWCVVEAEHRLRHKIDDLLEEIGENADG